MNVEKSVYCAAVSSSTRVIGAFTSLHNKHRQQKPQIAVSNDIFKAPEKEIHVKSKAEENLSGKK